MEKSDIIDEVHTLLKKRKLVHRKDETKEMVDTVFNVLKHNIESGYTVNLYGFGQFESKPRVFNNVRDSGTTISRFVIKFTPSRVMKDRINEKIR